MAGHLVPDIRTDRTGRTQTRWVKPGQEAARTQLPPPAVEQTAGLHGDRLALAERLVEMLETLSTAEEWEDRDDSLPSADDLASPEEIAERVAALPEATAQRALEKVGGGDTDYTTCLLLALTHGLDANRIDALTRFSSDVTDLYQGDEGDILADPDENTYTVVTQFVDGLERDYGHIGYRLPADICAASEDEVNLMKVLHWLRETYGDVGGGVPNDVAKAFLDRPDRALEVFWKVYETGNHNPEYVKALLGEFPALAEGAI